MMRDLLRSVLGLGGATAQPRVKVLFVCMGNICRSPTAEGVLRKFLKNNMLEKH